MHRSTTSIPTTAAYGTVPHSLRDPVANSTVGQARKLRHPTHAYYYELLDLKTGPSGRDNNFGLLRNDLSPKPAYVALSALLEAVADPGPELEARMLDDQTSVSVPQATTPLARHPPAAPEAVQLASATVTLTFPQPVSTSARTLDVDGHWKAPAASTGTSIVLEVPDRVVLVQIWREPVGSRCHPTT